jgi:hypothetical protein
VPNDYFVIPQASAGDRTRDLSMASLDVTFYTTPADTDTTIISENGQFVNPQLPVLRVPLGLLDPGKQEWDIVLLRNKTQLCD